MRDTSVVPRFHVYLVVYVEVVVVQNDLEELLYEGDNFQLRDRAEWSRDGYERGEEITV